MFLGDFALAAEDHGDEGEGATEDAGEVAFVKAMFFDELFEKG